MGNVQGSVALQTVPALVPKLTPSPPDTTALALLASPSLSQPEKSQGPEQRLGLQTHPWDRR